MLLSGSLSGILSITSWFNVLIKRLCGHKDNKGQENLHNTEYFNMFVCFTGQKSPTSFSEWLMYYRRSSQIIQADKELLSLEPQKPD